MFYNLKRISNGLKLTLVISFVIWTHVHLQTWAVSNPYRGSSLSFFGGVHIWWPNFASISWPRVGPPLGRQCRIPIESFEITTTPPSNHYDSLIKSALNHQLFTITSPIMFHWIPSWTSDNPAITLQIPWHPQSPRHKCLPKTLLGHAPTVGCQEPWNICDGLLFQGGIAGRHFVSSALARFSSTFIYNYQIFSLGRCGTSTVGVHDPKRTTPFEPKIPGKSCILLGNLRCHPSCKGFFGNGSPFGEIPRHEKWEWDVLAFHFATNISHHLIPYNICV